MRFRRREIETLVDARMQEVDRRMQEAGVKLSSLFRDLAVLRRCIDVAEEELQAFEGRQAARADAVLYDRLATIESALAGALNINLNLRGGR